MTPSRFAALLVGIPLALGGPLDTQAKTISSAGHSPKQVKQSCSGVDDAYFPKTSRNGTWGCLHADGSGIVCGGYTAKYKRTCDTFRRAPDPTHLPSRPAAGRLKD